jgi:uncharacterized repeat protein (TIGR04138 family)
MVAKNFHEVIQLIRKDDTRYESGAYTFMRHALDHTLGQIREQENRDRHRHVTGQELCEGIRDFALEQYGPMALTLLQQWGIRGTEDFGQIVFNLVEYGIFGKTDSDSLQDFDQVYDFDQAFGAPFRPSGATFRQDSPSLSKPAR